VLVLLCIRTSDVGAEKVRSNDLSQLLLVEKAGHEPSLIKSWNMLHAEPYLWGQFFVCFWGMRTRDFAFVSLCYGRSGEEICKGYAMAATRPNAI
jgi:hypothetical protein